MQNSTEEKKPRKPKICIKRAGKNNEQWMVVVKGGNGRVLVTSELFEKKSAALNNVDALQAAFFLYRQKLITLNIEP